MILKVTCLYRQAVSSYCAGRVQPGISETDVKKFLPVFDQSVLLLQGRGTVFVYPDICHSS